MQTTLNLATIDRDHLIDQALQDLIRLYDHKADWYTGWIRDLRAKPVASDEESDSLLYGTRVLRGKQHAWRISVVRLYQLHRAHQQQQQDGALQTVNDLVAALQALADDLDRMAIDIYRVVPVLTHQRHCVLDDRSVPQHHARAFMLRYIARDLRNDADHLFSRFGDGRAADSNGN